MDRPQIQIHGGMVTETITADTTHLVVDGRDVDDEDLKPLAVMQAVSSKLGGLPSLRLFKQSMLSGKLKLVSSRCRTSRCCLLLVSRSGFMLDLACCCFVSACCVVQDVQAVIREEHRTPIRSRSTETGFPFISAVECCWPACVLPVWL